MYWKWIAIALAALAVVLVFHGCNCGSGGGWLGKVTMFRNPQSTGQETFVNGQEK